MNTTRRDENGKIMRRNHNDPEATVFIEGYGYFAEYEAEEARKQYEEECAKQTALVKRNWLYTDEGKLCGELYNKFQRYKEMMEKNPYRLGRGDGKPMDFPEHMLFAEALGEFERAEQAEIARKNLEKAQRAARCQHTYLGGQQCGCPRMRGKKLCYMHERLEQAQAMKLDLGPMEDPESIQLGIKKLQAAIIDGSLDYKQVSQLSYLIQVAAWNVRNMVLAGRYVEGQ
jgi:hypothetical protein